MNAIAWLWSSLRQMLLVAMVSWHNRIQYKVKQRGTEGRWLWSWWRWRHDEETGVPIPCLSPWGLSSPATPPSIAPFLSPAHNISSLLLVTVWWIKKERGFKVVVVFLHLILVKLEWCKVTALDACLYLKGISTSKYNSPIPVLKRNVSNSK